MQPIININGTDGHDLLQETFDACNAVKDAINVLRRMTVHGRDYPTGDPVQFRIARDAHNNRLVCLAGVQKELEERAIAILDQLPASPWLK